MKPRCGEVFLCTSYAIKGLDAVLAAGTNFKRCGSNGTLFMG